MSWEKERDKWLKGNVPPKASKSDVEGWLRNDPVWNKADKVAWREVAADETGANKKKSDGSHFVVVYVKEIGKILPEWRGDTLSVSDSGGREVKGWIVKQLVKGYEIIKDLQDAKKSA